MAYEKQTWVSGEIVTSQKMNHIEAGIEAAAQSGGGGSALDAFDFFSIIHDVYNSPYILGSDIEDNLAELPDLISFSMGSSERIYLHLSSSNFEVDDDDQIVGVDEAVWSRINGAHMDVLIISKGQFISCENIDISSGDASTLMNFGYDSSTDRYVVDTSNNS